MQRRRRAAAGVAIAGLLIAVACDKIIGNSLKDGFGGVRYRCNVILDELSDPRDFNPSTPYPQNRCVNTPELIGQVTAGVPDIDTRGNTTGFLDVVPNCTTYLVDACMPRKIMPFGASAPVNLEDYLRVQSFDQVPNGDIAYVPDNLRFALKDYCMLAAFVARELELKDGVPASNDPAILQLASIDATTKQRYTWVTVRSDFVEHLTGAFFDPAFGTQPLHTAPAYCRENVMDNLTPVINDNSGYFTTIFPIYDSALQPYEHQRSPAGLVEFDAATSPATVTLLDGDTPHASPTSVSGEIMAELVDCTSASGRETCDLKIKYVDIELADFRLAGHNVSGVALRNEGDGRGQSVDGVVAIPTSALPLAGQLLIEGQGVSVLSFNNPTQLSATWDPVNNTFQMNLALQSATANDQTVLVNGVIRGRFRNRSPIPVPPPDQTVECAGPSGTTATLDGTSSFDYDGNLSAYEWRGPDMPRVGPAFAFDPQITTPPLPLGKHEFFMTVKDSWGYTDQEPTHVTVVDTQPPVLTVSAPDCLWPPNHRFIELTLGSEIVASAVDQCSGDVSSSAKIIGVTSSDPAGALGSGNTQPDYAFDEGHVCLRAERSGPTDGRTYTVTLDVDDGNGNHATKSIAITVPHDEAGQQNCGSANTLPSCSVSTEAGRTSTPSPDVSVNTPKLGLTAGVSPSRSAGACAISGRGDASGTLLACILLIIAARSRRTTLTVLLVGASFFAASGCSSATSHGSSNISVQIGTAEPIHLTGDPVAFVQGQSCSVQVLTNLGTAFLSGTVSTLSAPTATIGPQMSQVVVWVKTADGIGPLSASSGSVVVNQFDPSTSGFFSFTIQNASKATDPSGPSMVMSGDIHGKWAQPN